MRPKHFAFLAALSVTTLALAQNPVTIAISNQATFPSGVLTDTARQTIEDYLNERVPAGYGVGHITLVFSDYYIAGAYPLTIQDFQDPGYESSGGYHQVNFFNQPYARVFAHACTPFLGSVSLEVCVSHEIVELIGNPFLNKSEYMPNGDGTARQYSGEYADFAGTNHVWRGNYKMANAVTPAWFRPGSVGPWDIAGILRFATDEAPGFVSIPFSNVPCSRVPPNQGYTCN